MDIDLFGKTLRGRVKEHIYNVKESKVKNYLSTFSLKELEYVKNDLTCPDSEFLTNLISTK